MYKLLIAAAFAYGLFSGIKAAEARGKYDYWNQAPSQNDYAIQRYQDDLAAQQIQAELRRQQQLQRQQMQQMQFQQMQQNNAYRQQGVRNRNRYNY